MRRILTIKDLAVNYTQYPQAINDTLQMFYRNLCSPQNNPNPSAIQSVLDNKNTCKLLHATLTLDRTHNALTNAQ